MESKILLRNRKTTPFLPERNLKKAGISVKRNPGRNFFQVEITFFYKRFCLLFRRRQTSKPKQNFKNINGTKFFNLYQFISGPFFRPERNGKNARNSACPCSQRGAEMVFISCWIIKPKIIIWNSECRKNMITH